MKMHDKTAIITGSASGIGAETVRLFLEAGANVVAVDVQEPPCPPALQHTYGPRVRSVHGDVALEATAKEAVQLATKSFGTIDVLINNAGIAIIKKLHEHTPEDWDRVMNINVKSIYWFARHVIPVMQKQGSGVILNTGSISSVIGIPVQGGYAASKGAVIQLTRQMAVDYAADGIRVNAVCPGSVDTPLLQKGAVDSGDPPKFIKMLSDAHPIGRIADSEEIAQFFLFLASGNARFITGSILMIDGGYTAR
jgi:NAD(P)-dependent dehydrogenase (short-subunit alcohol dehydrogenase family)